MDDTNLTPEEQQLIKKMNQGSTYGQTGSAVGSAIGTGLGLATLATPLAPFASLITPAAGAIGGSIGGLIGGSMGSQETEKAAADLQKLREKQQVANVEKAARAEAFQRLLGKYSSF